MLLILSLKTLLNKLNAPQTELLAFNFHFGNVVWYDDKSQSIDYQLGLNCFLADELLNLILNSLLYIKYYSSFIVVIITNQIVLYKIPCQINLFRDILCVILFFVKLCWKKWFQATKLFLVFRNRLIIKCCIFVSNNRNMNLF